METIQNTDEKFVALLEIKESLANAIRRSLLEIPTLAVDELEVFKNDSALYDEIISHRIGLTPLKTEKSMNSKTSIDFKLSKSGPGMVYSEELEGPADVVFSKIPITFLAEGGKLELVATAKLGIGLDHSKHVPGLCYYRHLLEVKSNPQIDKIVEASKSGLVKAEKKGSSWTCDLSEAEIEEIESIDKDAISNTDKLIFIVESYGNMPAKDIFQSAIKVLGENLKEFEKAVK
jgi:DNA-directed RNA polymerase subunit D